MRTLRPSEIRVAGWAVRALRTVRAQLRDGLDVRTAAVAPAEPPRPATLTLTEARRVADAVLTRGRATCLERTVVQQALELRWGQRRDVLIGVRGGSRTFAAHAWLDGDPSEGYGEVTRRPPSVLATGATNPRLRGTRRRRSPRSSVR
jgi:hypothetical protein